MVDFRRRFLSLLSYKFREFGSVTALSILEAANAGVKKGSGGENGNKSSTPQGKVILIDLYAPNSSFLSIQSSPRPNFRSS